MTGGVITVSRRKYAANLFWQPIQARDNPRESAAKIAHLAKNHASLFVSFNRMVGVSSRRQGVYTNMTVAAPEVIESFGESTFLAAFSVKEGWWLLAVRGGIIIKDKVFTNIETVKSEYLELNKIPDWPTKVAPSDWGMPSAIERNISDIMSGNKKYRLGNISHVPGYLFTAAIIAAVVYFGYGMFKDPIKKLVVKIPDAEKVDRNLAEEYKKKLKEINTPKPRPVTRVHLAMPFENLPKIEDKADQCWRAIAFLSQQLTGWVSESVTCMDGFANAHLLRNHGTIGDLYSQAAEKMPGIMIDETDGEDVILTAKLRKLDAVVQSPEYSVDDIVTAVQSVFQRLDENVQFSRDFIEIARPQLKDNEVYDTTVTEIPVVKIAATSKLKPSEFIKIMDDIISVDIKTIKWDNRNRNWIYDVLIYAK